MNVSGNITPAPNLTTHVNDKGNPHVVTAEQIGAMPHCNIQYVHILDNGYEWDSGTDTLRVHAYWIGATNKQWTQTFECKVIYM